MNAPTPNFDSVYRAIRLRLMLLGAGGIRHRNSGAPGELDVIADLPCSGARVYLHRSPPGVDSARIDRIDGIPITMMSLDIRRPDSFLDLMTDVDHLIWGWPWLSPAARDT